MVMIDCSKDRKQSNAVRDDVGGIHDKEEVTTSLDNK
jgi:hypothetical protein